MRWMNLEPVIQSEVSQTEKDIYCIHNEAAWEKLVIDKPKRVSTDYYSGILLSTPLVICFVS